MSAFLVSSSLIQPGKEGPKSEEGDGRAEDAGDREGGRGRVRRERGGGV